MRARVQLPLWAIQVEVGTSFWLAMQGAFSIPLRLRHVRIHISLPVSKTLPPPPGPSLVVCQRALHRPLANREVTQQNECAAMMEVLRQTVNLVPPGKQAGSSPAALTIPPKERR